MEDSHVKKNKKTNISIKRSISNVSDVLHAFWIRLPVQINNGLEWLILDSRYYVLFNFRVLLAIIFFVIQIFKK